MTTSVVDALLQQCLAEALRDTALDLPFDNHRIDHSADVVHAPIADHAYCAGVGIDFDFASMCAVAPGKTTAALSGVEISQRSKPLPDSRQSVMLSPSLGKAEKRMQLGHLQRREFITLSGGALAWPLAASAQEPGRIYRLATLTGVPRDGPQYDAVFEELRQFGFVEGQNLNVDPSGFGLRNEQLAPRAAAIVKAAPDVILCGPALSIRILQQATRTIPLVGQSEDMVAEGLVASLARPGGNTTGISLLSPELDGKRQEILIATVPGAHRIAAMVDAKATSPDHIQVLQQEARSRGIELLVFSMSRPEEIASAMDAAKASGAEALNFLATPLFSLPGTPGNRIVMERIAAARLPAIFQWPETAEAGALLAYGPRFVEMYRERARMVVKILRGAKPADIPIEQPTRFELIVNLKAAKSIRYEVPNAILLRADEVIE